MEAINAKAHYNTLYRSLKTYGVTFHVKVSQNSDYIYTLYMYSRVFEAWVKSAQQWIVCAPLRIHLEPISKELNCNCAIWPKQMDCKIH